jgi:two-component sensor histidine kinase
LGLLFVKAVRDINIDREAEAEAAERLRDLLRQRTLLLDEVNHRVKNSLQQVASVVRLQARSTTTAEAKHALDNTLSRIMAVGRVHEQIYKSNGEIGSFDAGLYARNLARELVDSMGRDDIDLKIETDFAILDMRQAGPIALVLNELITNALKYGCPPGRQSCIWVRFKALDGKYQLTVADDGDGLPPEFSANSKSSLGMRAIHALARQLGGEFVVEDSQSGAVFTMTFPKSDS